MKGRCLEVVSVEIVLASGDGGTRMKAVDERRCRMQPGHKGDCRFNMILNARGRVADAEVRWKPRSTKGSCVRCGKPKPCPDHYKGL